MVEWSISEPWKLRQFLMEIGHEITPTISEFVRNSIEKVKPVFLLSSMCISSELNETKSYCHSFHLQNSYILQTIKGQSGDPMKINFDNFQMEKWVSETGFEKQMKKMGSFFWFSCLLFELRSLNCQILCPLCIVFVDFSNKSKTVIVVYVYAFESSCSLF